MSDASPKNQAPILGRHRPIRFDAGEKPMLIVVVDTEEEFNWAGPFDRRATSIRSLGQIGAFQGICEAFEIRPTYVVDYAVADRADEAAVLTGFVEAGRATIGAHLHPWINPPHEEEVSNSNSYPGNLGRELEERKLLELTRAIESAFKIRPSVYKAGRYGVGPSTGAILEAHGFEVDMSVCPPMDFRRDNGPDFAGFSPEPYWFGEERRLLEIPMTGAFVGWLRGIGPGTHKLLLKPWIKWTHASGVLSLLRALDRLRLSPEGHTIEELRRLTRALLRRGVRTFTFSLHSPSFKPGCTPYVRTEAELRRFLDCCQRYFEFFRQDLGGVPVTPLGLKTRLDGVR